ncbi:MAG: hypothetical protein Q9191_003773 [Dirinaria sp. TL-2023a]
MAPTILPAVLAPQTKRSRKALSTRPNSRTSNDETTLRHVKDDASGLTITHIASKGDLLLEFKGAAISDHSLYLVSSETLRQASAYFRVLLDADKFGEGESMNSTLAKLLAQYGNIEAVPAGYLPRIVLEEDIPKHNKIPSQGVIALFLGSLHNVDFLTAQPDTCFLALLAILSDRFDTTAIVRDFIIRRGWKVRPFAWDGKYRPLNIDEETLVRQQILIGLLLGLDAVFTQQCAKLIVGGSARWTENIPSVGDFGAPWYGYDSSPACNSYQLGQMVRFFRRTNTLEFESTLYTAGESIPCKRNILEVIAALRACPEYQIDENHKHCGIRKRFVSALQSIAPEEQAGICARCWSEDAAGESWQRHPAGGAWEYMPNAEPMRSADIPRGCLAHRRAKAMYTAMSRDWT